MIRKGFFLSLFVCAWLAPTLCNAQGQDDLLSTAVTSGTARERAASLIDLSTKERIAGRFKNAVEYAILGSSEAEKNNLPTDQTRGLLELAMAYKAKGETENAIGAAVRATLVNGTAHSTLRTTALLYLSGLYVAANHPQKALEHLEEARHTTAAAQVPASSLLRVEVAAKASTLQPAEMEAYCSTTLAGKAAKEDLGLQFTLWAQLATAQARLGKNMAALESEDQVMRMAIAQDRPLDAAICANNKAELYNRAGKQEQSIEAYNQGLILVEDLPDIRLNMAVNVIQAMALAGHRDAALRMLEDAKRQAKRTELARMMPRVLLTASAVHLMLGDLQNAQTAALDALANAQEQSDEEDQVEACEMLTAVFERMHLDNEARQYERRGRDIGQGMAKKQETTRADHEAQLLRLQRIEREQTDLLNRDQRKETRLRQLALDADNHEKQLSLLLYEKQLQEAAGREAAMVSERTKRELLLVQASLDKERQQRRIQELDNGRMAQALNISKLTTAQKEQQQAMVLLEQQNKMATMATKALEAKQAQQQAVRNLVIAVAIAALILAGWMYWAWLVARRKKRMVTEQNQHIKSINSELNAKNQDIESSLGYARTIQSTIIPKEQTLRNLMPESFLMYKPLQNVSGDLPFVREVDGRIFVAAIDCTGHGVPAAMMTFIAYYGLNDLLLQHPHANSAELLDLLHDHVRKAMNERSEGGLYNDGFDIGLCIIDIKIGNLCFSGAQLPLLLVRNGQAQRFKGDILPLGDDRFERKAGYKRHSIELHHGDALYLFSDGLIHQFGGESGEKKFSMKRLSELLERADALNLPDVKTETERAFEAWRNGQSQTDDVLLIGMRYAA